MRIDIWNGYIEPELSTTIIKGSPRKASKGIACLSLSGFSTGTAFPTEADNTSVLNEADSLVLPKMDEDEHPNIELTADIPVDNIDSKVVGVDVVGANVAGAEMAVVILAEAEVAEAEVAEVLVNADVADLFNMFTGAWGIWACFEHIN